MKFLVDNCVGGDLADWLKERGHDVIYSPDIGADPGDDELLEYAATHGRIVITQDRGFAQSVYIEGAKSTGIIFIPEVPPRMRLKLVEAVLAEHAKDLEHGAWVILRRGKVRIRKRPGAAKGKKA